MSDFSLELRKDIINMIAIASSGHPGGSLSMVEIMSVLYNKVMHIDPKNPDNPDRDIFILSKGHAAPVLYATLANKGYFSKEELKTLRKFKSPLQGHPDKKKLKGVETCTGSLGQGVSQAVGFTLGFKSQGKKNKVYTVVGDGEIEEGLFWEASMSAAHYKLSNLTIIIDKNRLQLDGTTDEVMSAGNVEEKMKAFGFDVYSIDGNNEDEVYKALMSDNKDKPKCIVANTIKGKGVSFMENNVDWHGKAPNKEQTTKALEELSK